MYAPITNQNPPNPWWDLWPGGESKRANPATDYPLDSVHFFALPVATGRKIAANSRLDINAILPDTNWLYVSRYFAISAPSGVTASIYHNGKTLAENVSSEMFNLGDGPAYVPFKHLLNEREFFAVVLKNTTGAAVTVNAAFFGSYRRGNL